MRIIMNIDNADPWRCIQSTAPTPEDAAARLFSSCQLFEDEDGARPADRAAVVAKLRSWQPVTLWDHFHDLPERVTLTPSE